MKKIVFQQWHFMRWVRLGLGIAIIVQAAMVKDWTVTILGAMFAAMAIFNVGCCGAGGCSMPEMKSSTQQQKEVIYEEVD
jgi:hypothetical protein